VHFTIQFILFFKPKSDANWGSSAQALAYNSALNAVHELNLIEEHVKNFRPQLLVIGGSPFVRPTLVEFANLITKNLSLVMVGHIAQV
jgi:solute carrier family 12 sodium/potassium/chloride transporter 2